MSEVFLAFTVSSVLSPMEMSDSRIMITRNPDISSMGFKFIAIARLISFSTIPDLLTAPPSSPPCPASRTIVGI